MAAARRPARVHGLGRADPDRFGRLPGLQPGRARTAMTDAGVTFRSHLDGRLLELTPERAIAIQEALGADVAMCLDHCPALPASQDGDRRRRRPDDRAGPGAARRPTAATDQALFGIVQGGTHADLRAECAEALVAHGLRRLRRRRRQRRRGPRGGPPGPRRDDPPPARRPAALPDGRRPAPGHPRRRRDRHRPVRLRDADPQRPQRNLLHRPRDRSSFATPPTATTPGRSRRAATAWPAAGSAGRTSATCSWPRRCSARSWRRSTT